MYIQCVQCVHTHVCSLCVHIRGVCAYTRAQCAYILCAVCAFMYVGGHCKLCVSVHVCDTKTFTVSANMAQMVCTLCAMFVLIACISYINIYIYTYIYICTYIHDLYDLCVCELDVFQSDICNESDCDRYFDLLIYRFGARRFCLCNRCNHSKDVKSSCFV